MPRAARDRPVVGGYSTPAVGQPPAAGGQRSLEFTLPEQIPQGVIENPSPSARSRRALVYGPSLTSDAGRWGVRRGPRCPGSPLRTLSDPEKSVRFRSVRASAKRILERVTDRLIKRAGHSNARKGTCRFACNRFDGPVAERVLTVTIRRSGPNAPQASASLSSDVVEQLTTARGGEVAPAPPIP